MSLFNPPRFALLFAVMLALVFASQSGSSGITPSAAAAVPAAAKASDDGIFKYTITTDIESEHGFIKIVIGVNAAKATSEGKEYEWWKLEAAYPIWYDLDCEGDGEFEYQGLTKGKCIYKKNSGKHQIWLRGVIPAMYLCDRPSGHDNFMTHLLHIPTEEDDSKNAILSVDSWGNVPWKSMHAFAAGCEALNKLPKDSPDLRQVNDMGRMFAGATSFNQPLGKWDVSNVITMSEMFAGATSFNQPLEKWNVSNVKGMNAMFKDATSFNQPLAKWNVSNVTNMEMMFYGASAFNQPLAKWNVSNVTNMNWMFYGAASFNQPLGKWNVSKVTNMAGMFLGAKAFSHYPKSWIVPRCASAGMFEETKVEEEAKKSPLTTKGAECSKVEFIFAPFDDDPSWQPRSCLP